MTAYTYGAANCVPCGGGSDSLAYLTDAKGQTTAWQYDLAGQLTKETNPLQKETVFIYDAAGNLSSRTDARGNTTAYTYDAADQLTKITYPDQSTVTYTYDALGRVLTAISPHIAYTYTYDKDGRVLTASDNRGYNISYQYDAAGNRTQMTLFPNTASQRITTYTYDNASRPTNITSAAGAFTFAYDQAGRRQSLSFPHQITASYTYDNAGRLTGLTHGDQSQTIASFTYSLDEVGNRTGQSGTVNKTYAYDALDRLTAATGATPETFIWDAVGNRLTGPATTDTDYLHNAGNQTLTGRQMVFLYDNAGNPTIVGDAALGVPLKTYAWDAENRLVGVAHPGDPTTVAFTYDPFGRRITKKVDTVTAGVTATTTFHYLYDNDDIAVEFMTDNSGATQTVYTHGPGTDEPLALERNNQYVYYHADGLGSIVSITDGAKNIIQTYAYDSFGGITPTTAFRNSFTYTGREYDEETGLYFYRARYYDPKLGRFLNPDPIGFAGGDTNLYAYVKNNPINYSDPEGLAVPFFFAAATYEVLKWGGAALIAMMTGKAIYETAKVINKAETASKQCDLPCPPCKPYPAGTIGYQGPHTNHPHYPFKKGEPHLHLYIVNQDPGSCKCFWNRPIPDSAPFPPLPGWVDLSMYPRNQLPNLSP
jgi:RHS repeat-associated protein